jgi:hypothetical protein
VSELHRIAVGADRASGSVIFVHGLGGDPFTTWGGKSEDAPGPGFWPRWIADDCKDLAVYSFGYEAAASELSGSAMSLRDRGQDVVAHLMTEPVLRAAPLAFVCHSLGGLVVKQLLRRANEEKERNPDVGLLLSRLSQVVFIATPHIGARLPVIMTKWGWFARPTAATRDLRDGEQALLDLHQWYSDFCDPHLRMVDHLVFRETQKSVGISLSRRRVRCWASPVGDHGQSTPTTSTFASRLDAMPLSTRPSAICCGSSPKRRLYD